MRPGLTDEVIVQLCDYEASDLPESWKAALALCDRLSGFEHRGLIPPELYERLSDHCNPQADPATRYAARRRERVAPDDRGVRHPTRLPPSQPICPLDCRCRLNRSNGPTTPRDEPSLRCAFGARLGLHGNNQERRPERLCCVVRRATAPAG